MTTAIDRLRAYADGTSDIRPTRGDALGVLAEVDAQRLKLNEARRELDRREAKRRDEILDAIGYQPRRSGMDSAVVEVPTWTWTLVEVRRVAGEAKRATAELDQLAERLAANLPEDGEDIAASLEMARCQLDDERAAVTAAAQLVAACRRDGLLGDNASALDACERAIRARRWHSGPDTRVMDAAALAAESAQRDEDAASIGEDPCPVAEDVLASWAAGYEDASSASMLQDMNDTGALVASRAAGERVEMRRALAWLTRRAQRRGEG